jgi:hypothetical protein
MFGSTEIGKNYKTLRLRVIKQTESHRIIYDFLLPLHENAGQYLKHFLLYPSHVTVTLLPYTSSSSHSIAN